MTRGAALAAILLLASCAPAEAPTADATPTPTATAAFQPTVIAGPSRRDYTPPPLAPEAEKGEKGARNLLLAWAEALEDRAFLASYALFGGYAERTGQNAAEYVAGFADYGKVTVSIGDGDVEGAAGSLYYEVPVTVTGDAGQRREGTIVLRRVNDVDGASPEQLRWHLERLEWRS